MKNLPTYDEYLILEKKWEKAVKSSHLVEITYDSDTKILEVEFHNGAIYQYKDVPKSVFRELASERTLLQKAGRGIKKGVQKLFGKDLEEGTYGTRFWDLIRRKNYVYERIK